MEARNRSLAEWFGRVRSGQILLPRFQRHEAWGHREVTSLLESVLRGLPSGAALILEIGDKEPFISRPLVGAPEPTERVVEHLLDGQQRLTALWRALHDDYEDRVYLVGQETDEDGHIHTVIRAEPTYTKKGNPYPLWLQSPSECWSRGWIPLRLARPEIEPDGEEVRQWAAAAVEGDLAKAWEISGTIGRYSKAVSSFNIPFLSLPIDTPKETALDVFINMNTSSVELSAYDIVVAQYEAATNASLHDQVAELSSAVPRLAAYRGVEDLLLDIAALREHRTPSQASYHRLDLNRLADDFDEIARGVQFAVETLESESIFDSDRLPTVAVLPVLGAIERHVPAHGDERGNAMALIRAYLWRAFATSRYEGSAGSRALQDVRGLEEALAGRTNTAPIFDEELFHLPLPDELVRARWPKNRQTLARAILCASIRRGAIDLADGAQATAANMTKREYHHLYPDAFLKDRAGLSSAETDRALNCALISWRTNRTIGAKPPLEYLLDRVEQAVQGEDEVRRRLESHLIPWNEFVAGDGLSDAAGAYTKFLDARADLVADYIHQLCNGREPTASARPV